MTARRPDLDYASSPYTQLGGTGPSTHGVGSYTKAQGERILEKGTGPVGEALRPPMHIYHMNHEDAKAIIAYLGSLPRAGSN